MPFFNTPLTLFLAVPGWGRVRESRTEKWPTLLWFPVSSPQLISAFIFRRCSSTAENHRPGFMMDSEPPDGRLKYARVFSYYSRQPIDCHFFLDVQPDNIVSCSQTWYPCFGYHKCLSLLSDTEWRMNCSEGKKCIGYQLFPSTEFVRAILARDAICWNAVRYTNIAFDFHESWGKCKCCTNPENAWK